MSILSIPFFTPWEARLPEVIRYLDGCYVDTFFKDGALRLSSFIAFRRHKDEQRGDQREGLADVESTSPNSEGVFLGWVAQESYVLCGTINEDPKLKNDFNVDTGFRICDTLAFAHAVSKQIPGCTGGMEGMCSYRVNIAAQAVSSEPFRPLAPDEDPELYGRQLHAQMSQSAYGALFFKPVKYAHQAEYRMIWFANGQPKESIDVRCPDAVQFCRRLDEPS